MRAVRSVLHPLLSWLLPAATALQLTACGGGGGGGGGGAEAVGVTAGGQAVVAGANVLPMTVDTGVGGRAINSPFVTVTVCQPGTSVCQEIDHVLVDTGSTGLRIAASALPAGLRQALPAVTAGNGSAAGQCAQFASGYSWGSVRRADVRLAGETAAGLPIQVIDDPAAPYTSVPAACSATGPSIGSGQGAKGILGVGLFTQDCGLACAVSTAPSVYFGCTAGGCTSSTMPLASQVSHPVASLPGDNNGVVLVLPPVPLGGSGPLVGSLVLGIGTQANNQLDGASVYTTDAQGFFTTVYNGTTFPNSFLDSGSNGLFFRDASIPLCGDFYCPPSPLTRSATNVGTNGTSGTVSFLVDDVSALPAGTAAAHLGGDTFAADTFDWGLPFFFGRRVFVARAGAATPYGAGPWWGY